MADEPQLSSGTEGGSNNKRKYEDQGSPLSPVARPAGLSSPPSDNSAPPPLDGIEIAKQRAQEIAARLTAASVANEAKRPRGENGSGAFDGEKGFSSPPAEMKPMSNFSSSAIPVSYGSHHGTSKKIEIPQIRVGVIIGKAGETIKYLQLQSGAKIQVQRDMDADPGSETRPVELMGTAEQISKAEQLINDVLAEAESGGSGIVSRRLTGHAGSEHFEMKIPNSKVGLVIGKGGETIKNMQARTGARIQIIPLHLPPGDTSIERSLHIDGTSEQIKTAKELVDEVINENRLRTPTMGGGYPKHGYQQRPPTSWGTSGGPPMQQPGYGYMQPGAYPGGPSPQYNMSQPPYGGYPPQPASGGYPSNWDQSAAPPNSQTTTGGGYDYYGQQSSSQQQQTPGGSAAPADNTGYNYNQPPASSYSQQGQGYPQDGYAGYHAPPQSGYVQPPSYDQQQGYGYGMPPTSQAGYGSQPPAQSGYGPGYGPPQGQKPLANPPVYGQTQQSPSTQGSYGQAAPVQPAAVQPSAVQPATVQSAPVQPGYTHSQAPSGYAQPDAGSQRAQSNFAATSAQPGYGPPPYGAPPVSQPGYGQAYNASYSGSYSQPPA